MPERAEATIARPPSRCYEAFCDARFLAAWVPGLRRATVVRHTPDGHALEVKFDHGEARSYSLVYAYDPGSRTVTWTPGVGVREAVSGSARFDDDGAGGCRMTYELASGPQRGEGPSAADVLSSFARWAGALR